MRSVLFVVAVLSLVAFAAGGEPDDWFKKYTPEEFARLPAAQAEINPTKFNETLLSAAIFQESNRRRAEQKVPPLHYDAKLRHAALKHAQEMGQHHTLSHDTPWRSPSTTPNDRIVAEGLAPRYTAENIASSFVLEYESGKPFYTREEAGRPVFSYAPKGPPLVRRTYLGFAAAIVQQWIDSPPHRKNLFAPIPQYLGIGSALVHNEAGMDLIYSTQNFYTPLL